LYRRHGFAEAMARVNGDFAIGLYDAATNTLWLGGIGSASSRCTGPDDGWVRVRPRPRPLLDLLGVGRAVNHRFVALFADRTTAHLTTARRSRRTRVFQVPAALAVRPRRSGHDRAILTLEDL
jgi:asparagine synthase (glutamine-hydrolysing)